MRPRRRTLQLRDAICPRCGQKANRRAFPETVRALRESGTDPDSPFDTHRCERCRKVYVIRAKAYLEAS